MTHDFWVRAMTVYPDNPTISLSLLIFQTFCQNFHLCRLASQSALPFCKTQNIDKKKERSALFLIQNQSRQKWHTHIWLGLRLKIGRECRDVIMTWHGWHTGRSRDTTSRSSLREAFSPNLALLATIWCTGVSKRQKGKHTIDVVRYRRTKCWQFQLYSIHIYEFVCERKVICQGAEMHYKRILETLPRAWPLINDQWPLTKPGTE